MKYIKLLTLSLMLLVSYSLTGMVDQSSAASTVQAGDQAIAYYNTSEADETVIQLTNVDLSNALPLHIQILDEGCDEVNFSIELTARDTDTITLRSDEVLLNGEALDTVLVTPTQGIIIATAVVSTSDNTAISSGGDLAASAWIIGVDGSNLADHVNAVHRTFDGAAFELIQPANILQPFNEDDGASGSEFIVAAWTDNYPSGQHFATSGKLETDALLGLNIFNDNEKPVSCLSYSVECVAAAGVTSALESLLDPGDGADPVVCDKSLETYGLVDLNDITTTTNAIVLAGMYNQFRDFDNAGLDYALVADAQEDPVVDCTDDPCSKGEDCAAECVAETCVDLDDCVDDSICDGVSIVSGSLCVDGVNQETNCTDVVEDVPVDNDGDNNANCADSDCANDAACQDNGNDGEGGGGGGGCSVATAATGLGSMANALVLLIPAFGIGARRIRQRLNK